MRIRFAMSVALDLNLSVEEALSVLPGRLCHRLVRLVGHGSEGAYTRLKQLAASGDKQATRALRLLRKKIDR